MPEIYTESGLRAEIVNTAKKFVGAREGSEQHKIILATYNNYRPLPRGYTVKDTDAWCAATTSAWAIMCGFDKIIPIECSCNRLIALAKKLGIWVESDNYAPHPGDICLYDWQDDGKGDNADPPDHVGLVTERNEKAFQVLEGNYSNSVKYRSMQVNGKYIRGFICPDYKGEAKRRFDAAFVAGFADVPRGVYYEKALEWAKSKGVIFGKDGQHFGPELECSRAQIVTMLWRLWGSTRVYADVPFTDVPSDAYYRDGVAWAYDRGIIKGISEDEFCPDNPCTRAEIVTMIHRMSAAITPSAVGLPFEDVPADAWYSGAVAWAYKNGITCGISKDTFAPGFPVHRCEMVALVHRWYTNTIKTD